MFIDREKCNDCGVCIEACPLEAISYKDDHVEISEECINSDGCPARQMCPLEAIEKAERAEGTIMCGLCPVCCEIRPGKVGECRDYKNEAGKLTRTVRLTPFESVKEIVGEDYDEAIRRPLLTGIGAGKRGGADPLIVQDKVNGVDVVTCVSESHYHFSGLKLIVNTERYLGDEGAEVYHKGVKVGRVIMEGYGVKTMDIGGVNTFSGVGKKPWVSAKVAADIANRKRVELNVKGGPKLEVQVGEKPVVDGEVMEKRRWGCGGEASNALYNDFIKGLVNELIVYDRGLLGHMGEKVEIEGLPRYFQREYKSGIKLCYMSPVGWVNPHIGGSGWGMTPMQNPLDIIESYDPKKLKPGFTLLVTEPCADRIAYFVFEDGKFRESEVPAELREALEEFRANCEPASVSAYFTAGAGGTARRSFVKRGLPLELSEALVNRKARVTVGGAPVTLLRGGGVDFEVDVQRVKPGSFNWTTAPALVAPIEWTTTLQTFTDIGGNVGFTRPLKEVANAISKGSRISTVGEPIIS